MSKRTLRSGLVVEVPAADPIVGEHRLLLDSHARKNVPAHITLLYPFMTTPSVTNDVISELAELYATLPAFDTRLTHTAWFGGNVVYLAPEDDAPYRELTRRTVERFPDFPPYEGRFPDSPPHLTIGHLRQTHKLKAAEAAVRPHLPIETRISTVTLMAEVNDDGWWENLAVFELADG